MCRGPIASRTLGCINTRSRFKLQNVRYTNLPAAINDSLQAEHRCGFVGGSISCLHDAHWAKTADKHDQRCKRTGKNIIQDSLTEVNITWDWLPVALCFLNLLGFTHNRYIQVLWIHQGRHHCLHILRLQQSLHRSKYKPLNRWRCRVSEVVEIVKESMSGVKVSIRDIQEAEFPAPFS